MSSGLEKVFGKHSVRAVFLARPEQIERMVISGKEAYHQDAIDLAHHNGITPEFLPWKDFLRLGEFTEDDKHQGIMVFAKPKPIYGDRDIGLLKDSRCVLILDQVSNPQNFATILRGAAFFGVDAVVTMKNRSVKLSHTVTRYAVGGAEFTNIFSITNVARTLEQLQEFGFWVYGLDERGEKTLAQTEFCLLYTSDAADE